MAQQNLAAMTSNRSTTNTERGRSYFFSGIYVPTTLQDSCYAFHCRAFKYRLEYQEVSWNTRLWIFPTWNQYGSSPFDNFSVVLDGVSDLQPRR